MAMEITDTRSPELQIPHAADTVVQVVTTHSRAELAGQAAGSAEGIIATVSKWDQQYALLGSRPGGDIALTTFCTFDEVRQYYIDKMTSNRYYGGEQRRYEFHGRWFELLDTECDIVWLDSGEWEHKRVVNLQPIWPDGIVGEIVWAEPKGASRSLNPDQLLAINLRLNAFDEAWRSGDHDARLVTIEDRTCSAIRVVEVNGLRRSRAETHTKGELRDAWNAPEAGRVLDLQRLAHTVTNMYAFALYKAVLEMPYGNVVRETAMILPLGPNHKFIGELSYSMEAQI